MERNPNSHKGDNGNIAIIGGSVTMHGAPIFNALAAEASGVDLIHICLPDLHTEVAKNQSLNFIVHGFTQNEISEADVEPILELLAVMDCAVIGSGITITTETKHVLSEIIQGASCPIVLDASALSEETIDLVEGKQAVLTPHLGELERMNIDENDIGNIASSSSVTIILKSVVDKIFDTNGKQTSVAGGNSGLTVGGTGDVLAGLIGGFISQKIAHDQACIMASTLIKRAATLLYHEKGYAFTASDIIAILPGLLHRYDR